MIRKHWKFFLIVGAVTAVALAGTLLNSSSSFALGEPAPALQADADGEICPLSPTQEKESIAAFHDMMPVFSNARCQGCHGAVNPFAADGVHKGGRLEVKMRTETDPDTGAPIVVRDDEANLRQCQDCHSVLKDWQLAPAAIAFVGKDSPALCQQMKFELGSAQTFMAHLEHDKGNFIAEAFKGTRALDDNGQATYENVTGNAYKAEPMPGSQMQFVELGRAWIKAMGGDFKGGDTCGCKPHHYALDLEEITDLKSDVPGGSIRMLSSGRFEAPITFKDDGSFEGSADESRSLDMTLAGPQGTCQGAAPQTQSWTLKGSVEGGHADAPAIMHLRLSERGAAVPATVTCQVSGFPLRAAVSLPATDQPEQSMPDVPAKVGETSSPTTPAPAGWTGSTTMKITIRQLD